MEDNWFAAKGQKGGGLVCAAKEVHLEDIQAMNPARCTVGQIIDVDINATVVFNTGRYDVGWYIALDGGNAMHGECAIKVLSETVDKGLTLVSAHKSTAVAGTVRWDKDFKGGNDLCGDIIMSSGGGGVLDFMKLGDKLKLPCVDMDGDGLLDFGICFSWREPGEDDFCDPNALYPGTPSKCFCTRYPVPQIVVESIPGSG
jgi:hypothetical protein